MKILVPVDGSKYSTEALHVAVDLAKLKGADLSIITVTPSFQALDLEISARRREELNEEFERKSKEVLNKACDIATGENVKPLCKAEITSTSIADAIIDFAEREGIDLIVMGSRGLSPSTRLTMGSVASNVAKLSHCSVYVVKI